MSSISLALEHEIQEFLLNTYDIENENLRKQLAREAELPDNLINGIEWRKQPTHAFISHLIERTLKWGYFGKEDSRYALIEYLKSTEQLGGGEHQQRLQVLLESLSDEIKGSGTKDLEPAEVKEVQFVNREREIRDLTDESSLSPGYAIHAPAGFGKTWLLRRIQQKFSKEAWLTCFAVVDKKCSILSLANDLLNSADCPPIYDSVDALKLADLFAGRLKMRWQQQDRRFPNGIVLLIDCGVLPTEISIFSDLIKTWLPTVAKNIYGLQFFSSEKSRLRTIISGRFFEGEIQEELQYGPFQFRFTTLSPFSDNVLELSVAAYLPDLSYEWRMQLWSNLFYVTGGHPGCSSRILKLYSEELKPEPVHFFRVNARQIQDIVLSEVKTVLQDFPRGEQELLVALSPFRYLSYEILEEILQHESQIVNWAHGFTELADYLTGTHLVSWDDSGYLLKDDITRRIMSLYLRYYNEDAQLFSIRCVQAREFYQHRLMFDSTSPARWAIEYLYQSLQMMISETQTIEGRSRLRRFFWGSSNESSPEPDTALYDCLMMLVSERVPRLQIDALQRALQNDWEFRFTLNYFLREENFDTKWFGILLAKVRAFLSNINRESGSAKGI